ncbi:MAG: YhdP family protein [Methylovulum sp.]|nr:YhdP family protein [Methylovulum sp.]
MIHHIKRATRHLIFWSLLATALSLTGIRLLLAGVDDYKSGLASQLSGLVGAPVSIGRLSAKMRGFSPELVLKEITVASIDSQQKPAVALKEIRLGLDLLATVINRELLSSTWVTLIGAKLSVQRKSDGSFAITGLQAGGGTPTWLLQGRKYEVLQSEITWQDMQAGTKPLKIDAVNLAIINDDDLHRINVMAQLPAKYGDALTLSMALQGNIFEPSTINGSFFAEIRQLNLNTLPPEYLPATIHINSGKSDVRLWGTLQQAQLVSLQGEAQLQQLQLVHQQHGEFPVKSLQTHFHWHSHTPAKATNLPHWQLDVTQFLLTTPDTSKHLDKQWPDAIFSIADYGKDVAKPLQQVGLSIRQIDLQEVSRLALLFAPLAKEQTDLLAQAQLQGTLRSFSVYADLEAKKSAINGQFRQISFSPVQKIPGVTNLTGEVTGNLNQGVLHLDTNDATVNYPSLFREALIIKHLEGAFDWRQSLTDWTLSSPLFSLDLLSIKSKNRLRLVLPKTTVKPAFVDLQMALTDTDISQLKHYFPTKLMNPADTGWLDVAFVKGQIKHGAVLLYGNLGEARPPLFEALLDVDQVELRYAPDWPHFYDVAGRVSFLQNKMICESRQGNSHNLHLIQATVVNEAVGVSNQLQIQGEVEGQIADALGFLQQTPLNSTMGPLINAVTTQGSTKVGLGIDLALNEKGYTKLDGNAHLNQAKLKVNAIDLWVNKINGVLKFNEHGVYSDTINAAALDNPIKITIDHTATETNVNVNGHTAIDNLKKQFKMPVWDTANGALDYRLKLGLPIDNTAPTLQVQSDLVGVALDLPGKLAKTTAQSKPLALTFSLGDELMLPITISYDAQLKAAVTLNVATQNLDAGHILLGPGTVTQPTDHKLSLEINQDKLELHDLIGFSGMQNTNNKAGANLKKIHIHSHDALWKNTPLGKFDLMLKPEGRYWAGVIDSEFAQGKITIPVDFNQHSQISADMDRLDLSVVKRFESEDTPPPLPAQPSAPLTPDHLPLFAINCRKTLWQAVDLGQLTVNTERIPGGIALKQAELASVEQQLTLSGEWKNNGGKTTTTVHGYLKMPNVGRLLSRLDITKEFKETEGHINFSAQWDAPPYDFSLATLSGEIDVNLKDGRLLSIEPGFGRVLGMLAFAQWAKRLQFDFRDLYEEGLMFNTIKGHFEVVNGIANTDNLIVDAIPAKITLTGSTDFVKKTVDQLVSVNPKSADAVPIAGTIMGNLMSLVTQTLTGDDYEGFFLGSQYQVKGQWDAMEIMPLHENDGLLQKTWTGITDFPWLQNSKQ